jgi:DNA-binding beta-propeller fold protein YncE
VAVFCVLVVGGLIWSAPAPALSQRGHEFKGFSFGGLGEGEGQLKAPAGVAVNEATGDVYVVDRGNNRIERFTEKGEFIEAWGWGVKDGNKEYEICKKGELCHPGIAGGSNGQFRSADAIAVDNSTSESKGDVYVISDALEGHGVLAKFGPEGERLKPLKQEGVGPKWEGALDGVAVDSKGVVWVYRGIEQTAGMVERFTAAAKNSFLEPGLEVPEIPGSSTGSACPKPGFAVDAQGEHVYADREHGTSELECPAVIGKSLPVVTGQLKFNESEGLLEPLISQLDPENTTAVAVEQSTGTTFIENTTSVAAFTAAGALIQRFGASQLKEGTGVAVSSKNSAVYVADAQAGKVDVFEPEPAGKPAVDAVSAQNLTPTSARLNASINPDGAETKYVFQLATTPITGTGSCAPSCTELPGKEPLAAGFVEQEVSVEATALQPSTTYYYRVVATNEHGEANGADRFGSITTLPSPVNVLADNRAWEMVSPPEKFGSSITAISTLDGVIQASEDGHAITYVATGPVVPEPEGNRSLEPTQILSIRDSRAWSTQDIVTPHEKGEGNEAGAEYRFFSNDLSLSLVQPLPNGGTESLEHPPLSPEVVPEEKQEKTMYVRDNAPLAPNALEQEIYRESEENRHYLAPGYRALVTAASDTAEPKIPFGSGALDFLDATPTLNHVVLHSAVGLTASPASEDNLYEWGSGASESQRLQLVSVLPGGGPAKEPRLGFGHNEGTQDTRNAVSNDGSRILWSTGPEEEEASGHHLYLRDTARKETIQIDTAAPPVAEPEPAEAELGYQTASSDGSKVFFTDTARLTTESNQEPVPEHEGSNPADLYECEVNVNSKGKLGCNLKDLTPNHGLTENSAGVLNLIPGASEDGSYVYFVANGVLAAGAKAGACVRTDFETAPPNATCNLYVWHNGTVTLIAVVSNEDRPDWGVRAVFAEEGEGLLPKDDLADLTSRVSPNGRYLAFMSNRSLTGYNNTDVNENGGPHADEEVFRYDAEAKLLVCASCNPSGARPRGVFDAPEGKSGEGFGLLVDKRQDWAGSWLAGSIPGWTPVEPDRIANHQPRYLSDNGRLFFNAADALVANDTNSRVEVINGAKEQVGVEDVYQYESNGEGTCADPRGCASLITAGTSEHESALLDASASGNDVFFVTQQELLAQDRDGFYDAYDAHACTEASPCLPPPPAPPPAPCSTSNSCNGTASPPPALETPLTSTFHGPGNVAKQETLPEKVTKRPITRAQQLANALKSCRKTYKAKKNKRRACEARARKKYGPKTKKSSNSAKRKSLKGKK